MKLLLVEDDPGIGRFVTNGLKASGFDVDWLRDGAAVKRHIHSERYAVLVLDLMLPDADGFQLCRELRTLGVELPILMLTARDSLEDKLEGFRAGADDYLVKPFSIDELVARLKAMTRRLAEANAASEIAVGELRIDPRARSVRMNGAEIELSRREYDLLLFLAQNAGQAITRERILQAAWGAGSDVTLNSTDVYIGYLRRKLRQAGDRPSIVTVRGVGFKLI